MSSKVPKGVAIDVEAPIDYEFIKSEITKKGPIRISRPHLPIEMILNIMPCACSDEGCSNDVIYVERKCGLSRIMWLVSIAELLEFESLNAFSEYAYQFGFANSYGERQIIERVIKEVTGADYHSVDKMFCACSDCMASIGPELVWKNVLLTSIAINLQQRNEWREWLAEQFEDDGNDIIELFDEMFELGYQTARMFGEYQLKEEIEIPAVVGLKAQKDQAKRAKAAGKVSQDRRNQRVVALLTKMEVIADRSPDIRRIGPRTLADLALSDVVNENPELWKQGKGRRDEYLDELKADTRYRKRYKAIFGQYGK